MKVLQFVTRLDLGGAQEACLDLCRALAGRGDEVHLLSAATGEMVEEARRVPGLVLHLWPDWEHAIRPGADLRCLLRLRALLRRERYDVLHTHSSKAGLVGRLAARAAAVPTRVVHHVHGWSFNDTQGWPVRDLYVDLERLAARPGYVLLGCSGATTGQGRQEGIGRDEDRRTVRYGIEQPPLRRARPRGAIRRRLGLGRRDLLFLQLGNLKPQKDPLTFARAAVAAGRRLRRARFWIAGDGPLRGEAERIAAQGGLGDRFRVLGWRRDVPDLLAACDAMVLTSRFEGLPLAILRAMAAGRPVLATAVDGTPEAVRDGVTGRLLAPGDAEGFARAFLEVGSDPARRRRMGVRGRESARPFAVGTFTRAVLALYAEAP